MPRDGCGGVPPSGCLTGSSVAATRFPEGTSASSGRSRVKNQRAMERTLGRRRVGRAGARRLVVPRAMREKDGPRPDETLEDTEPIEISPQRLSAEALIGLVAEFVSRDGTDYGVRERTLEEKIADVMKQIENGEVRIFFDPVSATTNILPRR